MNTLLLADYKGKALPDTIINLLHALHGKGITIEATGRARKTIIVSDSGQRRGYINSDVIRKHCVLGYVFEAWGYKGGACPEELIGTLVPSFCSRYSCQPDDVVIHHGTGSNSGRTFLLIKNPNVVLRAVLQDSARPIDQAVEIVQVGERLVEGALRDVRMQRYERSSAARQDCLSHYGFDCYVCHANMKLRYRGLPNELIHVHHEEPLAASTGPREVDPIAELKPVCPNCHAVIHSRTPPFSVDEVRDMLGNGT